MPDKAQFMGRIALAPWTRQVRRLRIRPAQLIAGQMPASSKRRLALSISRFRWRSVLILGNLALNSRMAASVAASD